MALFKGKLFAGALFAGALISGTVSEPVGAGSNITGVSASAFVSSVSKSLNYYLNSVNSNTNGGVFLPQRVKGISPANVTFSIGPPVAATYLLQSGVSSNIAVSTLSKNIALLQSGVHANLLAGELGKNSVVSLPYGITTTISSNNLIGGISPTWLGVNGTTSINGLINDTNLLQDGVICNVGISPIFAWNIGSDSVKIHTFSKGNTLSSITSVKDANYNIGNASAGGVTSGVILTSSKSNILHSTSENISTNKVLVTDNNSLSNKVATSGRKSIQVSNIPGISTTSKGNTRISSISKTKNS